MKRLVILCLLCSMASVAMANDPNAPVPPLNLLLDFGNAALTEGPDINGNTWNNVVITSAGSVLANMVDDANNPTDVNLVLLTGSYATASGALTDPDPNLLGDMAIATVTGDYHAQLGSYGYGPTSFQLTGLDPDKKYVLSIYGGRLGNDANDVRITQFDVQGTVAQLQTTGPIGDPNGSFANGNDSTILVTDAVAPDVNGVIQVTFEAIEGGIGYLGAMKVEEVSKIMYVDFGNNALTVSPDLNGNTWNNATEASIADVNNPPVLMLVDDANNATDVNLVMVVAAYPTNSGALANPDPNLLGDLAVSTATGDYFLHYPGYPAPSFLLTGLDPNQAYVLRMYAGRDTAAERVTQYEVVGANTYIGTLQTSGEGLGVDTVNYANGNDSTILATDPITPNEDGEIQVSFSALVDIYGYLGAMKIVAF